MSEIGVVRGGKGGWYLRWEAVRIDLERMAAIRAEQSARVDFTLKTAFKPLYGSSICQFHSDCPIFKETPPDQSPINFITPSSVILNKYPLKRTSRFYRLLGSR